MVCLTRNPGIQEIVLPYVVDAPGTPSTVGHMKEILRMREFSGGRRKIS